MLRENGGIKGKKNKAVREPLEKKHKKLMDKGRGQRREKEGREQIIQWKSEKKSPKKIQFDSLKSQLL